MAFVPLHVHTHYSLNRAVTTPVSLAERAAELGYGAMAMTDYGNLGCAVDFVTAMKKQGLKSILGCEFSLCREASSVRSTANGRPYSRCIVLAKNLAGWKQLLLAVSRSASRDVVFQGPRLNLEDFGDFAAGGNLIAISGYMGSDIADALFERPKLAYPLVSYPKVRECVKANGWDRDCLRLVDQYRSIFGPENFFLSAEIADPESLPATLLLARAVRDLGRRKKVPCVATPNVHYLRASLADKEDQQVVVCAGLKTTFRGINSGRAIKEPDTTVDTFFKGGTGYHLASPEEMREHHTQEEMDWAGRVAEMCQEYDILSNPKIPPFACPSGLSPEQYLRDLCERGWRDKIQDRPLPQPIEVYRDRLEMELGVINGAGLASYFLIVQDFMNYGRERHWILGTGRGSGAGCIVSWMTGITGIDPIQYGLIFERFYNAGRNAPGRVSLPDIDSDIPKYKREEVFQYLQGKYGEDRVAKIATFSAMQGRSALTEVMSVHGEPFDLIKRITKSVPDKARISEELEEMRQSGEKPSVIGFCLDFLQEDLREWVQVEQAAEDGGLRLTGQYARWFEQAMRLEGTKTHIGMHAAGVAIGSEPLAGVCPMKWDETHKCYIAALEWTALEAVGVPKFDVLAVAVLDKAEAVRSLVRTGRIGAGG